MTHNKLLQSHPSVRHRWLKRVKTSRAAYLKDGQNQQTIGKHMTPIPKTRGAHNEQREIRCRAENGEVDWANKGNAKTVMISFFDQCSAHKLTKIEHIDRTPPVVHVHTLFVLVAESKNRHFLTIQLPVLQL
jgi:hypothetical protein